MTFPATYPPQCPEGAYGYTGLYYRFQTSGNPQNPKNHQPPVARFKDPAECGNWGLSGYLTEAHLEDARQRAIPNVPNAAKWPVMAYDLTPHEGEIKCVPMAVSQHHHDLWLYDGVDIAQKMVTL